MENNPKPTVAQIEEFLTEYGWHFRKTQNPQTNEEVIIAPFSLNESQGILISFAINGEFVMVSSVGFLDNIPKNNASDLLILNDTIKLVKLFAVPNQDENLINVDLSFELWAESWNKATFFCFMDMLALAINKMLEIVNQKQIPHHTKFVEFVNKNDNSQT
jgi:hypothetical protein